MKWFVVMTQGQGEAVVSKHKTKRLAMKAADKLKGQGSVGVRCSRKSQS